MKFVPTMTIVALIGLVFGLTLDKIIDNQSEPRPRPIQSLNSDAVCDYCREPCDWIYIFEGAGQRIWLFDSALCDQRVISAGSDTVWIDGRPFLIVRHEVPIIELGGTP